MGRGRVLKHWRGRSRIRFVVVGGALRRKRGFGGGVGQENVETGQRGGGDV